MCNRTKASAHDLDQPDIDGERDADVGYGCSVQPSSDSTGTLIFSVLLALGLAGAGAGADHCCNGASRLVLFRKTSVGLWIAIPTWPRIRPGILRAAGIAILQETAVAPYRRL